MIEIILKDDALLFLTIVNVLLGALLLLSIIQAHPPGGAWFARRKARKIASRKWYFKNCRWTKTGYVIDIDSADFPRVSIQGLAFHSPHINLATISNLQLLDVVEFEYSKKPHKWILKYKCCAYLTITYIGHF